MDSLNQPPEAGVLQRLSKLIGAFKSIDHPATQPPTYLEVTRYPHFENVASNLLQFFLDPEESHGLGTLFLDALVQPLGLEDVVVNGVEREAQTSNGKRMDLLLDFESHLIGVENKLNAPVYNPLTDYSAHLLAEAKGRSVALILLCVDVPKPVPMGVVVVTYEQFMGRVRQNLGLHATDAPAQYLTFALDFVKTMENLRKGSRMNPAVLDLLKENQDDVAELLGAVREAKQLLRDRVHLVGTLVDENRPSSFRSTVEKRYWRVPGQMVDVLVHDVTYPSSSVIAIDAWCGLEGWQVTVFQRKTVVDSLPVSDLASWLRRHDVPFLVTPGYTGEWRDRVVTADFEFDASLDNIADHVAQVVAAIAQATTAPGEDRASVP